MVAVLFCRYIGLFASKAILSVDEKTETPSQTISLYAFISRAELPGVVMVSFPGEIEPGFVEAMLQLLSHQEAVVSQVSYTPVLFGRSTTPFPQ